MRTSVYQLDARQRSRVQPFGCVLLACGLLLACGEEDPTWTHPSWGSAPLDTQGPTITPPQTTTVPGIHQSTTNDSDPLAQQGTDTDPTPVDTTGTVLRLDNVEVTTTGWAACEFYDWKMIGLAPWLGLSALSSIPLFGASIYQAVKWGKRLFALSDLDCDVRVKATIGDEQADMEYFDNPIVLLENLDRSDLAGKTLNVQLLDCEFCEDDGIDWTTTIGVCEKPITSTDLDVNGMQVDCIFEPMQWLERQASGSQEMPPEDERAFPTVSARLSFSFRK